MLLSTKMAINSNTENISVMLVGKHACSVTNNSSNKQLSPSACVQCFNNKKHSSVLRKGTNFPLFFSERSGTFKILPCP